MTDELPTSDPLITSAVRIAARVDISDDNSKTLTFPFGREYKLTGLKILHFRALLPDADSRNAIQENDPIFLVAEDGYKGFTVNAMEFRDQANSVLIKDILLTLPFQHPETTFTILGADPGGVLNFGTPLAMDGIAFKAFDVQGRVIYKNKTQWPFTETDAGTMRFDIGMQLTYEL